MGKKTELKQVNEQELKEIVAKQLSYLRITFTETELPPIYYSFNEKPSNEEISAQIKSDNYDNLGDYNITWSCYGKE